MRHSRRLAVVGLACVAGAGGCTASRPPSGASVVVYDAGVPITVQTAVGPFRLVDARSIQGAPTDTNFRFQDTTGFGVSVIRYPVNETGSDTVRWLTQEGGKFATVQELLRQRGVIDSFQVRISRVNPARADYPAEHLNVVQTWSRRGAFVEVQYLYVIGGRFLKIRGSERDREAGMSPTAQFARSLVARMAPTQPR